MKRNARFVFAATALLVVTAIPGAVLADEHEEAAPTYTIIHFDDVGPANAPAYEENAKAWVAAFEEAKMGSEWAWRTYSGPNFNYAFLTDVPNYAYMDGASEREKEMVEAIGADKIEMLTADGGGSTGHRHELTKDLPELTYVPEGFTGEYGFVHLSTHSVKPGMGKQFRDLLAKVTEARKTTGRKNAVFASQIEFGNGSYQFATVAKDAAAFYGAEGVGPMLVKAYGPEEAEKMFASWRECITDFETSDWVYEPELSYRPGMHSDEMMKEDMEEMGESE